MTFPSVSRAVTRWLPGTTPRPTDSAPVMDILVPITCHRNWSFSVASRTDDGQPVTVVDSASH